jgi:hypothetical protein
VLLGQDYRTPHGAVKDEHRAITLIVNHFEICCDSLNGVQSVRRPLPP